MHFVSSALGHHLTGHCIVGAQSCFVSTLETMPRLWCPSGRGPCCGHSLKAFPPSPIISQRHCQPCPWLCLPGLRSYDCRSCGSFNPQPLTKSGTLSCSISRDLLIQPCPVLPAGSPGPRKTPWGAARSSLTLVPSFLLLHAT